MTRYGKTMSQALAEMRMDDPKLLKVFNKLKPKDTVQIKISSTIAKGKDFETYLVKSKNTLRNGVEKISMILQGNPTGAKRFMYNRNGKVTFAIGDMGASIDDIKEEDIQSQSTHDNDLTHSKEERQPDEGTDEAALKAKKMTPGELDEDAKMAKQSDDNLKSMMKKMRDAEKKDPKMPSTLHMIKRIEKEMKKRGLKEEVELDEGYESEVLKVLRDADIEGYFKNNKLYVSKRDARDAKKALEDSDDITKLPKMVMEEVELDEAGSQGMFLVIQGENDNKQKVISMHKRKADAIKARDAWNDKNKPTKRTHKARVYEVGKFATTDGKPKTFKVGDNVMYSDFARSIVKEEVDPADVDITATDKDVENASKNIILQLRKVITLRGMKPVEFASGKEKVNPNIAQKALSIHQNLRRTDEKDAFQRKIARSYKDLLNAVKGRK